MPIGNRYNGNGTPVTKADVDAAKKRYAKPVSPTQYYLGDSGEIRRTTPKLYHSKAERRRVIKARRDSKNLSASV